MIKGILLTLCSFISLLSLAQVERKINPPKQNDSVSKSITANEDRHDNKDRREMMKELDLTKEQRAKFKEIHQNNKTRKEAISNDDKLSNEEKQTKLRALQKEQQQSIMNILNEEQRQKMKEMRNRKMRQARKDKNNPGN